MEMQAHSLAKIRELVCRLKAMRNDHNVLLLGCKVKTKYNSQLVFYLVSFKVRYSVLQILLLASVMDLHVLIA